MQTLSHPDGTIAWGENSLHVSHLFTVIATTVSKIIYPMLLPQVCHSSKQWQFLGVRRTYTVHLGLCVCVPVRQVDEVCFSALHDCGRRLYKTQLCPNAKLLLLHICHRVSKPCLLSVMSFYLLPEVLPLHPQLSSQKPWTLDAMISDLCVERIPVWLQPVSEVWHIFPVDWTTSTSFLRLVSGLKVFFFFLILGPTEHTHKCNSQVN